MSKHTPGPWEAQEFKGDDPCNMHIVTKAKNAPKWLPIATMCGIQIDAPANARLIAAAPELLEALQDALKEARNCGDSTASMDTGLDAIIAIIEPVIAKATGAA